MQVLSFQNGKERYCLKVEDISQVLSEVDVVPLPRAPNFFDGIFQLRGKVIGLLNFRAVLTGETEPTPSQILVLSEPRNHLAIRVPGMVESHFLKEDRLDLRECEEIEGDFVEGIVYDGQEIYHILSASKIFLHARSLITQAEANLGGGERA